MDSVTGLYSETVCEVPEKGIVLIFWVLPKQILSKQIRLSTSELDKITTQLSKLDLEKTTSQTSTKFVLEKPRK